MVFAVEETSYSTDWEALGLSPGACVREIRSAFRRKVRQCHPDVCPGDETAAERLKAVMQSYQRLMREQEAATKARRLFASATHHQEPLLLNAHPAPLTPDSRRMRMQGLRHGLQTAMLIALLASPILTAVLGGILARPYIVRATAQRWESPGQPLTPGDRYAQMLIYTRQSGQHAAPPATKQHVAR